MRAGPSTSMRAPSPASRPPDPGAPPSARGRANIEMRDTGVGRHCAPQANTSRGRAVTCHPCDSTSTERSPRASSASASAPEKKASPGSSWHLGSTSTFDAAISHEQRSRRMLSSRSRARSGPSIRASAALSTSLESIVAIVRRVARQSRTRRAIAAARPPRITTKSAASKSSCTDSGAAPPHPSMKRKLAVASVSTARSHAKRPDSRVFWTR